MAGHPPASPSDAGFEVVRRGYDQGQVDAHLRRLDAEVSILVTDREAALGQAVQLARELDEARVRAEKLRAQVRTLASPQQSPLGTSERIRSMLRLAEDEVADMLARAETEANRRKQEADAQAAQTLAAARADADTIRDEGSTDAEKMRQEIAQERAAFDLERTSGLERLAADRMAVEADLAARLQAAGDERVRAWAESEARRKLVEEDFTIAMDQRRSEALAGLAAESDAARRELEELRESAAAQAREVIAHAEARARESVAEAEYRIADLALARARIAEQLSRTRTMLEDTLGSLALPPEELVARALPSGTPASRENGSAASRTDQIAAVPPPALEAVADDSTAGRTGTGRGVGPVDLDDRTATGRSTSGLGFVVDTEEHDAPTGAARREVTFPTAGGPAAPAGLGSPDQHPDGVRVDEAPPGGTDDHTDDHTEDGTSPGADGATESAARPPHRRQRRRARAGSSRR